MTMIRAITCRPWSSTWVWNTMEISADEAIEPRKPKVRNSPEAVPIRVRRDLGVASRLVGTDGGAQGDSEDQRDDDDPGDRGAPGERQRREAAFRRVRRYIGQPARITAIRFGNAVLPAVPRVTNG